MSRPTTANIYRQVPKDLERWEIGNNFHETFLRETDKFFHSPAHSKTTTTDKTLRQIVQFCFTTLLAHYFQITVYSVISTIMRPQIASWNFIQNTKSIFYNLFVSYFLFRLSSFKIKQLRNPLTIFPVSTCNRRIRILFEIPD